MGNKKSAVAQTRGSVTASVVKAKADLEAKIMAAAEARKRADKAISDLDAAINHMETITATSSSHKTKKSVKRKIDESVGGAPKKKKKDGKRDKQRLDVKSMESMIETVLRKLTASNTITVHPENEMKQSNSNAMKHSIEMTPKDDVKKPKTNH